jgi:predicted metal-dependent hydrolase
MRYELVRSDRKTLALTVDREGRVIARAPLHMPESLVAAFIREKPGCIDHAKARFAQLPPPRQPLTLADGATLPYLGGNLTLPLTPTAARVRLEGAVLLVPSTAQDLSPVVHWAEKQVRALLLERVAQLGAQLALKPSTFRLTHARGRWGSMSTRGTLSLNRALIHCPQDVNDYVIVHELCHITHPNHSAQFWALVERHLPRYRVQRDWLKANQSLIRVLPG